MEQQGQPQESTEASAAAGHARHGEHTDTIENVDEVFRHQRKLSFSFGAVFFIVTLMLPVFTVWWPWWWDVELWGGFTANYLIVSLFYFVFLWVMAWTYSSMADKLDLKLAHMDDEEVRELEIQQIREAAAADAATTGEKETT